MAIARDDEVLGGGPRIEGTRIGVRHVAARAVEGGQTPAHVADQLDMTLAAVDEAISYDDANRDEIRAFEDANDEAFERIRESSQPGSDVPAGHDRSLDSLGETNRHVAQRHTV